jgi:hypothetical protein
MQAFAKVTIHRERTLPIDIDQTWQNNKIIYKVLILNKKTIDLLLSRGKNPLWIKNFA